MSPTTESNRLLAALSASDQTRLEPHLTAVKLNLKQLLERPNKAIQDVYFIDSGIASVVAVQSDDTEVEIGLVGREGMTGSAILLGGDRSPHSTYIQAVGSARRIAADALREAVQESPTLARLLLGYVQSFMVQTAHTAVANARGRLPERLARWLLMAQDRIGGNTLPLTHEFLALMLGVRRAGVTETLHVLTRRRLIKPSRGQIEVLNRKGLESVAGGYYGLPEREYQRLMAQ